MPEEHPSETEIHIARDHQTQKERLATNRFYNPELDRGVPAPHRVSEIEAFLHLAFWVLLFVSTIALTAWFSIRALGLFT